MTINTNDLGVVVKLVEKKIKEHMGVVLYSPTLKIENGRLIAHTYFNKAMINGEVKCEVEIRNERNVIIIDFIEDLVQVGIIQKTLVSLLQMPQFAEKTPSNVLFKGEGIHIWVDPEICVIDKVTVEDDEIRLEIL